MVTLNTYTTSIGAFVAFVNVSANVLPFTNVVAPVTVPPVTAPYVALNTLIRWPAVELLNNRLVGEPLQILALLFVTLKLGLGLTVTTIVKLAPTQNVGVGPVGITV